VSIICGIVANYLFYGWAERKTGSSSVALSALLLFLVYPGRFYQVFVYTESLFLLLVILALVSFENKAYKTCFISAVLLAMCRSVGIFISGYFALKILEAILQRHALGYKSWSKLPRSLPTLVLVTLAPIFGFGIYLLIMKIQTGNAFTGFAAQSLFFTQGNLARIFQPASFWKAFLDVKHFTALTNGFMDRFVFVLMFLFSLPLLRKDKALAFFSLSLALLPTAIQHFGSNIRLMAVVFPAFLPMGFYFGKQKLFLAASIIFFGALYFYLMIQHSNCMWVA
jgi:hypothetical protein